MCRYKTKVWMIIPSVHMRQPNDRRCILQTHVLRTIYLPSPLVSAEAADVVGACSNVRGTDLVEVTWTSNFPSDFGYGWFWISL